MLVSKTIHRGSSPLSFGLPISKGFNLNMTNLIHHETILIYISRIILITLIGSSLGVVLSKHTLHALFYLILTFFNSSLLLITLKVEFFGLIFLVIYLGAIAILFIFIVMMLNLRLMEFTYNLVKYLPVGAFLTLIMLFELILFFQTEVITFNLQGFNFYSIDWVSLLIVTSTIELIGNLIYLYLWVLFFSSAVILLIGMVGSIVLTLYINYSYE